MNRYTIREHKYESDTPMARLQELENKVEDGELVEVAHGSWGFDGIGWTCSECGEYALSNKTKMQVHSIYCPHCGAKMDGERKTTEKNEIVFCKDCKHLMFSDCYGECRKAYRGIVNPNDYCGKGEKK